MSFVSSCTLKYTVVPVTSHGPQMPWISRKAFANALQSVDQKPNVWVMIAMDDGRFEDSQGDAKHSIQFQVQWLGSHMMDKCFHSGTPYHTAGSVQALELEYDSSTVSLRCGQV